MRTKALFFSPNLNVVFKSNNKLHATAESTMGIYSNAIRTNRIYIVHILLTQQKNYVSLCLSVCMCVRASMLMFRVQTMVTINSHVNNDWLTRYMHWLEWNLKR